MRVQLLVPNNRLVAPHVGEGTTDYFSETAKHNRNLCDESVTPTENIVGMVYKILMTITQLDF